MDGKTRVILLSLLFAVPIYYFFAHDPQLPQQTCLAAAAITGVVLGAAVHFAFNFFSHKRGKRS